jgi:chromosome segregation ATPase
VEEESFPGHFKKLEDKIEDLIQTCRHLQQTKSKLEARIYELEGALKAKVAAEQEYAGERSVVRSRIDDLLTKLDEVLGSN